MKVTGLWGNAVPRDPTLYYILPKLILPMLSRAHRQVLIILKTLYRGKYRICNYIAAGITLRRGRVDAEARWCASTSDASPVT